jgi:hypothetical protein
MNLLSPFTAELFKNTRLILQTFLQEKSEKSIKYTVECRLSDLNRTEEQSDDVQCQIIRKTSEKNEAKYQLNLQLKCYITLLNFEENTIQHQIKKYYIQNQYLKQGNFVNERVYFFKKLVTAICFCASFLSLRQGDAGAGTVVRL